jgi:hypothetical protein
MKNRLSPLILTAVLALMLIGDGCASAVVRHPRETDKVMLSVDHPTPDVALDVVNAVEIMLPPGPAGSEGYIWEIGANNVKILEQMGPLVQGPPATATFFALKPGHSVLQFVLVRPGETEATPAAKCQVTVRVSD